MRRLYALDATRGVAALIVALHHLSIISGHSGIPALPFLAVDLFFAISGYVMARTYEERLRSGALTTSQFVGLRYRRLFLPLAIGTTLGLLWRLSSGFTWDFAPAYALALAFLPAFWLGNAFLFNVPAWSLFLEIVSNALHARIIAKLPTRTLVIGLISMSALTAVLLSKDLAHWGYGLGMILSCLPRELCFYLAGIIIFRRLGDAPFGRLQAEWAAWLGALSYPLYATHVPIIHLAAQAGMAPAPALALAILFAWALAVTVERRAKAKSSVANSAQVHVTP